MCRSDAPTTLGTPIPKSNLEAEGRIRKLVVRFYEIGRADPVLGPLFEAAIPNWPEHIAIVSDFWSHALLGTNRYRGNVFGSHLRLPIEPVHFDLWLAVFRQAAAETLTPMLEQQAVSRALHMTQSITVGLFPYKDADGKPTRKPPF